MKIMKPTVAALAVAIPFAAQADDILYSSIMSNTHFSNAIVMRNFADAVAAGTNGEHELIIRAGGVLATDGSMIEAIGDGVVESGSTSYSYTPALVPVLTFIGDLPGPIPQITAAATTELMHLDCAACAAEMETVNIFPMTNDSTESFSLMCNNTQIANLAEGNGRKVRAIGAAGRMVSEMGMSPVTTTYNEIYEALQRGAIDCAVIGANALEASQLWDVTDTLTTNLPMGTSHGYSNIILNRDMWLDFTPEQRRLWLDNAADILVTNLRETMASADRAVQSAVTNNGLVLVEADAEFRAALDAATARQTGEAIKTAEERGVTDAAAIAETYAGLVEKWTAIYDEINAAGEDWNDDQWNAFHAKVKAEIYDNISEG